MIILFFHFQAFKDTIFYSVAVIHERKFLLNSMIFPHAAGFRVVTKKKKRKSKTHKSIFNDRVGLMKCAWSEFSYEFDNYVFFWCPSCPR